MAKQRIVNTKFWEDGYIVNLLPDEKLLFLYFLTSPLTNISGIYECPIKIMAVHTGFDKENLESILERFEGKIHYIDGWVYIRNFIKHQSLESKTIKRGIQIEMAKVPQKIKDEIEKIEKNYDDEGKKIRDKIIAEETPKDKAKRDANKQMEIEAEEEIKKSVLGIVGFYNEQINKRASLTKGAEAKIKCCLKEFTEDELLESIRRFSMDDWRMKNNRSMGIEWFFGGESKVDKWLQLEGDDMGVIKI